MVSTYLNFPSVTAELLLDDLGQTSLFRKFCCRQFQKTSISCGFGAHHDRLYCSLAKWPSLEVSSNSRYNFLKASESKIAGSSNNN